MPANNLGKAQPFFIGLLARERGELSFEVLALATFEISDPRRSFQFSAPCPFDVKPVSGICQKTGDHKHAFAVFSAPVAVKRQHGYRGALLEKQDLGELADAGSRFPIRV